MKLCQVNEVGFQHGTWALPLHPGIASTLVAESCSKTAQSAWDEARMQHFYNQGTACWQLEFLPFFQGTANMSEAALSSTLPCQLLPNKRATKLLVHPCCKNPGFCLQDLPLVNCASGKSCKHPTQGRTQCCKKAHTHTILRSQIEKTEGDILQTDGKGSWPGSNLGRLYTMHMPAQVHWNNFSRAQLLVKNAAQVLV
jgi:hypothetical protein